MSSRRLLLVDLNNFASFPTLAIGILIAATRNAGMEVRLMSPLAFDVPAAEREKQEWLLDHWKRRLHLSTWNMAAYPRDLARNLRRWWSERPHPTVIREVRRALSDKPDVLLLSAYLQHFHTVREIAALADDIGIPVLLGGPMFNLPQTAKTWSQLRGITAVVGAEADRLVPELVERVCAGQSLHDVKGVTLSSGIFTGDSIPLRDLDATPIPDFTDFPWHRYPVRIIPLMTGRGCQWNQCTFCSDIISVSGRSFRTRSVESVLLEMEEQARRHSTKNFLFLDLKLNSFPNMLRGIASEIQDRVQGAEWIGTVHVDQRADNGLSRRDLMQAAAAGMRRISFGLESGSQRLLDLMKKGCCVDANSQFLRNAFEAGISVRCTMFKGYPGETAADMEATVAFLEANAGFIDRIRFNEFSLLEDTPAYRAVMQPDRSTESGQLSVVGIDHTRARAEYRNPALNCKRYRRAKARALKIVFEINRQPVRSAARQFDGLM